MTNTDTSHAVKRVAFVSQALGRIEPPKAHGSIAIWTYETAKHLRKDYAVLLLELGEHSFGTKVVRYEDLVCVYVASAINRVLNKIYCSVSRLVRAIRTKERRMRRPQYSSIFYNLGYILQAAWQARRWRSDIIHVHNFSQFVPAIRLLNPAASIVLHMNCEWLSQHEHAMIGRRVKKADAIICCSNHVKEELLERFPECRAKSHVVFNGVNIEHFLPGERRLDEMSAEARILFVGRVSPEKGVHVLIEAFTKVACQVPNVFLDVVGGGGSLPLDYLVAISSDRVVRGLGHFYGTDYLTVVKSRIPVKLRTRVVFHGNVEHDALAGHYRKATVFASPSLSDAFPLTVVEAMSAGLPIVASAVGGIREAVVDGETGLLVEPDNPNALAEALTRLLVDADTRNRIGTAARARAVELFSWKAISEQVVRIYAAVEGSNGRAYGRHRGAI